MKEQLEKYLDAIQADYADVWLAVKNDQREGQIKIFREGLKYTEGKSYIKVISGSSVHSFIVKEDGPKFKKGDILKAAGWQGPAKNKARGNIFGDYTTQWTGAPYLR